MKRRHLQTGALTVAAWIVVGAFLAPLAWMVLGSFKNTVDFLAYPPVFAFRPTLANYRQVFADNAFPRYVLNSTVVAAGATLIGLMLGIPAAYALARFRRTAIGVLLLSARMAPGIAFLIPLFVMFLNLRLVGSYISLIASHLIFTLPLTVWMMVGFIEAIPAEVEQAAMIDGCSLAGVLARIVVPLTTQGIAATSVLAFIASWNNFLFALGTLERPHQDAAGRRAGLHRLQLDPVGHPDGGRDLHHAARPGAGALCPALPGARAGGGGGERMRTVAASSPGRRTERWT